MDQIFAGEGTGVDSGPVCKMQTGLLASVPVPGFSELADSPLNTSRCSNQA